MGISPQEHDGLTAVMQGSLEHVYSLVVAGICNQSTACIVAALFAPVDLQLGALPTDTMMIHGLSSPGHNSNSANVSRLAGTR